MRTDSGRAQVEHRTSTTTTTTYYDLGEEEECRRPLEIAMKEFSDTVGLINHRDEGTTPITIVLAHWCRRYACMQARCTTCNARPPTRFPLLHNVQVKSGYAGGMVVVAAVGGGTGQQLQLRWMYAQSKLGRVQYIDRHSTQSRPLLCMPLNVTDRQLTTLQIDYIYTVYNNLVIVRLFVFTYIFKRILFTGYNVLLHLQRISELIYSNNNTQLPNHLSHNDNNN